jgi:hypothetical protein
MELEQAEAAGGGVLGGEILGPPQPAPRTRAPSEVKRSLEETTRLRVFTTSAAQGVEVAAVWGAAAAASAERLTTNTNSVPWTRMMSFSCLKRL